ncbi:hypothetical protein [Cellulophaga fucicola]|uniref:Uncharacterized protein n=1 Tax=Cellulophaga fucicola TaxID=76595 RepID=A0A1K1QA63_9FLAO|nr:hypothetical protein [Cellulophaga fucicola]SFW56620.1 hypothetical protein SAMN05660313_02499 [Cellulophaga fucicola]
MVFNSLEFLLFFPIVFALYYIIPNKSWNIFLLLSSYYFNKYGVKVLDLNKAYKKLDLKKEDFLDLIHVNWLGANKVSIMFSEWMKDQYNIKTQ